MSALKCCLPRDVNSFGMLQYEYLVIVAVSVSV